jgi:hypothetical protein
LGGKVHPKFLNFLEKIWEFATKKVLKKWPKIRCVFVSEFRDVFREHRFKKFGLRCF